MELVRKYLSASEITPAGTRYNPDCDCIQVTSDGGTTWTDAAGLDPRHADSFRVPPLSTADPKCDAAANLVAFLHSMIDVDIAAANIVAESTAFIGLVTLFFPVLLLADLVIAVAGIIAGIGAIALADAFTSTVYDNMLCTFYNHLEPDGSITASGLTDLLADVNANYDATVYAAFSAHSSTLGEVGWSNAAASGTETGDCTACVPPVITDWQFYDSSTGVPVFPTSVEWLGGVSYRVTNTADDGGGYYWYLGRLSDACYQVFAVNYDESFYAGNRAYCGGGGDSGAPNDGDILVRWYSAWPHGSGNTLTATFNAFPV